MRILILLFCVLTFSVQHLSAQSLERAKTLYKEREYQAAGEEIKKFLATNQETEGLLLAGDIYLAMEYPDTALQFYTKAEKKDGDKPEILRRIGKSYSLLGQHQTAITYTLKAVKKKDKDALNQLAYGEALIAADSLDKAELVITNAKELDNNLAEAYLALGNLYFAQNIWELARMNYSDALAKNDGYSEARMNLAISYYKLANAEPVGSELADEYFNRSLREWNTLSKLDSNNARAFFEQGKIFYFAQQYANAAKALLRFIKLRPNAPNTSLGRWWLAQSYMSAGLFNEAIPELKIVSQTLDSVKTKSTLMLAKACIFSKNYEACAFAYNSLSVDPTYTFDAKDWEYYGIASISTKDTITAITAFRNSLKADPKNCLLAYRFGSLLRSKAMYADAIEVFKSRLENCNDSLSSQAAMLVGVSFFSMADSKEKVNFIDSAISYYQRSISLDKSNAFSYNQMGNAYKELNQLPKAKEMYRLAIANETDAKKTQTVQGYLNICNICLSEKAYKELTTEAKNLLAISPDNEFGHLYLALSYHGASDKENACKAYKEVLKRNPKNGTASQNLKSLGC
jgi:Tfp pilus assembly protein PilF